MSSSRRAWAARASRGVIRALSRPPNPKTIEKRSGPGPSCAVISRAELQLLRSLRDKKHREELGLYAVEGEKIVAELVAAGHRFEKIYGTEAWTGAATHRINAPDMARASHFPTPSSVLAVGRIRRGPSWRPASSIAASPSPSTGSRTPATSARSFASRTGSGSTACSSPLNARTFIRRK